MDAHTINLLVAVTSIPLDRQIQRSANELHLDHFWEDVDFLIPTRSFLESPRKTERQKYGLLV